MKPSPSKALIDLVLFLTALFLVRAIDLSFMGFWWAAMTRSVVVVGLATILLYWRGQSWKYLGLTRYSILKTIGFAVAAIAGSIFLIIIYESAIRDNLFPEEAGEATERFSELKDNWSYFFSIIVFVWVESVLEELQDRGFSLNRFDALFQKIPWSIVLAVLIQACIFGFRHMGSHGVAGAITTVLIGLAFGVVYVLSGRNLWPVILAHVLLNTMSMIERV